MKKDNNDNWYYTGSGWQKGEAHKYDSWWGFVHLFGFWAGAGLIVRFIDSWLVFPAIILWFIFMFFLPSWIDGNQINPRN